ncbi:MAG: hypothetical protein NZM12_02120 [Steroidobacteraceae bacterium]|nr:hypothetical protein [Steroidobacteraceae bacterium]MDW8260242.1 hypothetical protein [Gammaproteobacteria bacterium]
MSRLLTLACLLSVACAAPVAWAACSYPKHNIKVPDGSTATFDEMKAAQNEVKAFDAAITAYSSCIEQEYNATIAREGANLSEERKKELERIMAQKINAAVKEAEELAGRFNEQVRVYKEKNKKK